jgi:hypothetical protein
LKWKVSADSEGRHKCLLIRVILYWIQWGRIPENLILVGDYASIYLKKNCWISFKKCIDFVAKMISESKHYIIL